MAIPTTEDRTSARFAAALQGIDTQSPHEMPVRRRRWVPRWLVFAVVVVALLSLGVAASVNLGLLTPAATTGKVLTEKVTRADLVVSITEDGNVESSHNQDVKCEVQGGSTILWIIADGTHVRKGDELVRLDSSMIEDQVNAQKILYEKARAAKIDAEKLYEASEISVQEYKEGLYLQTLQQLEANVTVAKENLESSRNSLQHTVRMHRKGYVTDLQRDAQAFAVQRAELDLQVAETAKDVLEKFTKAKTLVGLESTRDSTKAKMASENAAFELEKQRLERLQLQLDKCTINAPDDGMVVWANDSERSRRGGGEQQLIEEGAMLREGQIIIRLPDLQLMQVKCTIHESKVESLQRGMRARIRIQDRDYQGTVTSVANQAEPSNWFSGNVREYAAIVAIDSDPVGLRPGMTAAVEVLIAHLKDVLTAPVQAVVEQRGQFNSWVKSPAGIERRPVILGLANNTRIEIKDGLQEGDEVLLNPRAVVPEARDEEKTSEQIDVKARFGGDQPKALPDPAGAGGPRNQSADGEGAKGGGGRANFNLMSLDKDGDKKVSRDEAPDQLKEAFGRIDANSDGFIDASEAAEARRRGQQRQRDGGQAGGKAGASAPGGQ